MKPKLTPVIALALTWLPLVVCLAFLSFLSLTPITPEEEAEAEVVSESIPIATEVAVGCIFGW